MKNVNQGKETPNPETEKVEEGDTANHFPNPKREKDSSEVEKKEISDDKDPQQDKE